jgi:O-antigen/teichoic acid export membrane protein
MTLLEQASRGYIWSQFGRLLEVLLLFLVSLVFARTLGPGLYGVFAFAVSFIAFCSFLATTGVGAEALGKFVPEAAAGYYRGGVVRLVRDLIGVRVVSIFLLAGLLFLLRHQVESFFGITKLGQYIAIVLIVFGLRSMCDLYGNVFSGLLELGVVVAGRSIVPLTMLLLVGDAILLGEKLTLDLAFAALLAGQSAALVVFLLAARKRIPRSSSQSGIQSITLRRILTFGLFAWLSGFFVLVLNDGSDVILLGWLLKDTRQIGWYAVGASLAFRASGLVLAWMPLMGMAVSAKLFLSKGHEGLVRGTELALKLTSLSLIPTMLLVARFAPQFVTLLYSQRYSASVPITRILCTLLATSGFLGFGAHAGILYILNREKTSCAIFGGSALFNMVLAIPMIKAFGIEGAALATGLSSILFASACAVIGTPACSVRWPWKFNIKVVVASLLGVVSTLWVNPVTLVGLVLACILWGMVFVGSLLFMKPLSSADMKPLRQINPKLGSVMERLFAGAA